jgi:hypothetical protein
MRPTLPLLLLAAAITSFSQIPTRSITTESPTGDHSAYDSTHNFVGADVDQYRGQTLYVKGMDARMRPQGYESFYSRIPENAADLHAVYKHGEGAGRINTKYEALADRYFKVEDVIRGSVSASRAYAADIVYLKLAASDKRETVYFAYDPRHEGRFPFLVQGYFEKLKRALVGTVYLLRQPKGINRVGVTNPKIHAGDTLTCASFFVEDKSFSLVASFKRADGEEILVDPQRIVDATWLLPTATAARYVTAFGLARFGRILGGQVERGMTKEMCEAAWGKPQNVNRIVYQKGQMEQWVYPNGRYLYFENDSLSTVQE